MRMKTVLQRIFFIENEMKKILLEAPMLDELR
jgi:hypothetical protein